MIPANISPVISANPSSSGVLLPFLEPTSVEVAEFDQLMGDFNLPASMTAMSSPSLTLTQFGSNALPETLPAQPSPESLLSTLEESSVLAFKTASIEAPTPQNAVNNQISSNIVATSTKDASLNDTMLTPSAMNSTAPIGMDQLNPVTTEQEIVESDFVSTSQLMTNQLVSGITKSDHVVDSSENASASIAVNGMNKSSSNLSVAVVAVDSQISNTSIPATDRDNAVRANLLPTEKFASSLPNPASSVVIAQKTSNNVVQPLALNEQQNKSNALLGYSVDESQQNLTANGQPQLIDSKVSNVVSGMNNMAYLVRSTLSVTSSVVNNNQVVSQPNSLVSENTGLPASGSSLLPPVASPVVTPVVVSQQLTNTELSQQTGALVESLQLDSVTSLLGDSKAVVFASTPVMSLAKNMTYQATSNNSDALSPSSQALNSVASAMTMSLDRHSDGAMSERQQQQSSDAEILTLLMEETPLSEETSQDVDGFSLTSPLSMNQPSAPAILATPLSLRQPQWTQDMAQRVQVMVNQSMDELEVRIDPLDLGPMKISLRLDEQRKAHISLSAQHGLTRDMLENALPRLKELLAAEGIELASAQVDSGYQESSQQQQQANSSYSGASDLTEDAVNHSVTMNVARSSDNLVDQYA